MSEKACKSTVFVPTLIVIILVVTFFFPRFIISQLGTSDPWACYLYQYGFGLIVFGVGILLIFKTKACQLGRGRDGYWFKWLIGGFTIFAVAHALWILLALNMPVMGGN